MRLIRTLTLGLTVAVAAPLTGAPPGPAEDLFARKCSSCHTVGQGDRVGPDLAGVNDRRDRAWLLRFVQAPSTMLDSDGDARALLLKFNGVRMPDLGLTDADTATLVDLLARCSQEPCQLAPQLTPVTAATADDVARGRALFTGSAALEAGGAPCLSCHAVRGAAGPIAGGRLAKDLTNAFARLGDAGLDAALRNPAFPLMNRIFAEHPLGAQEVFALRAFLYESNRAEPVAEDALSVLLVGVLGTVMVLVGLNAAWGRRLRGVRRSIAHHNPGGTL